MVMRLVSVLVFEPSLTVVFSYSPSVTEASESLETALSQQLRLGALPACDAPVSLVCADHPVALQRKGDLLYAVASSVNEDELAGAINLACELFRAPSRCLIPDPYSPLPPP